MPPVVAARTARRGSTRASVSAADPRIISVTAGASRRVPLARPAIVSPSPTTEPRMRKRRRYSLVASPLPPMTSVCPGSMASAAMTAPDQPEQAEAEGPRTSCAQRDRQRRGPERDDDEDDQAHVGSIGWASAP